MANRALINPQILTDIADSIREKTGKTEPIKVSQMASEIGALKPLGTLDGLENGYDVMFYDENNEGLAFYSIKEGHTINPPVYNCKAWQTENGNTISFPYTPSKDIIVYAINDSYANQLYEFYGVDSAIYPYVTICWNKNDSGGPRIGICFGDAVVTETSTSIKFNDGYRGDSFWVVATGETIEDYSDINRICEILMQYYPKENLLKTSSPTAPAQSYYYVYTNYAITKLLHKENYRLDQ